MFWSNPEIQSSIIHSVINVIPPIVVTIFAIIISRQLAKVKRVREKLSVAQCDIAYLLAVEAAHCEIHRRAGADSGKLRVRRLVEHEHRLIWSGRFTPGRVRGSSTSSGPDPVEMPDLQRMLPE